MEALKTLLFWAAPTITLIIIAKFWDWLVRRLYGEPRPRIVAILILITIAIPALIFVVLFNIERAGSAPN